MTGLALAAVGVAGAQSGGGDASTSAAAVSSGQVEVFVGMTPVRVLDTRWTDGGPIGIPAQKIGPGRTIELPLTGADKPLPLEAASAMLNVTVDQDASLKSYLSIWPTGEPRPNASANNAEPGLVSANTVIARLGANDSVSIYNHQGETNVIIDVVGYFIPADQVSGLGTQFLTASGAPDASVGEAGDMYLDSVSGQLYGPRTTGGWGTPVAALNADRTTSYQELSEPAVLSATSIAPVDTFTAPADGTYILEAALTVWQTAPAPVQEGLVNIQCRWRTAPGVEVGQLTSGSIVARTNFEFPNTIYLGPEGRARLSQGETATVECGYVTGTPNVFFQVLRGSVTATRTTA